MVKLVKVKRGLYAIKGTRWAIGRTDDLYEGPRGGSKFAWELRRWEENGGWIIDFTPDFRTLREARAWINVHLGVFDK